MPRLKKTKNLTLKKKTEVCRRILLPLAAAHRYAEEEDRRFSETLFGRRLEISALMNLMAL